MIKQILASVFLVTTGVTIHASEMIHPHPINLESIQIALRSEKHKDHTSTKEKEEKTTTPKKDSYNSSSDLPFQQPE